MKYCPNCRTEYADDNLQFCLNDGTPLVAAPNLNTSPDFDNEPETLVIPKQVVPINFEPPSAYQTNQAGWQPSQPVIIEQRAEKKSNTAMVVALTFLGTILLLGLGSLGTWLYLRNNKTVVSVNVNTAPQNRVSNSNAAANQTSNANLAAPTPTATPTALPTLNPKEAKEITNNVEDVIDEWKSATEDIDLDSHMSQYADTVDYYKAGKVSIAKIRADRQKAFNLYESMNVNIKNMKVTPDPSGEKATAVFDKEWTFEGEDKYSSGEVQQQLTLDKIGGKWRISGEKELKVYRVEK